MNTGDDESFRNFKKILVLLGDPRLPDPVKKNGRFNPEDFAVIEKLKQTLLSLPGYQFYFLDDHYIMVDELKKNKSEIDLVFNLCDEGFFNNPKREKDIPEILELHGLPYSGAGAQCMQHCFDKALVLQLAQSLNVPVPLSYQPSALDMEFPIIVKPASADGGVGITQKSIAWNHSQLIEAYSFIRSLIGDESQILIQEFLTGPDLTIGLIGNTDENLLFLPIIEEDYSDLPPGLPPICGYEAKWEIESPYWHLTSKPAQLSAQQRLIIEDGSRILFKNLGCRDYARFDWRIDSHGQPKLLEANPNCGWCWDGHLAKMANIYGWAYDQLLFAIIKATEQRYCLS